MSEQGDVTREDLRERYGVESEFARVKEVSKIMGVSKATIYAQIRQGEFPLPVRRVGEMPLIPVDRLLAWLNEPDEIRRLVVSADAGREKSREAEPEPEPEPDVVERAIANAMRSVERARSRRSAAPIAARRGI